MVEQFFDENRERFLAEWRELLAFPSISSDPAHDRDCHRCAQWLANHLAATGLDAQLLETSSKPVVFAHRQGAAGGPVVLFYGHYDVQPVDPLEEWDTPPFQPEIREGRMWARGAEDNKGQLLYALKAVEALVRNDVPCPTIKILLEGEEESGSEGLSTSLPAWRDLLKADVLMVCDTGTVASGAPTIIMGLRGIIHLTATLSGPSHDLHSGIHGGLAPNPAAELARLIAGLHHPDGGIAVKGFCDSVTGPTDTERELANAVPFDPEAYRRETGVLPEGGEKSFTAAERVGFRPSIDINGIHSGFGGDGSKTIIPAKATAKITARLTAGQDPDQCLAALVGHLENHTPRSLQLAITGQGVGGPGFCLDPGSALVQRARKVLDRLTDQKAVFLWEGASVPVVCALAKASGAEPLLVGFGAEADRVHAPNESFSLAQFELGYRYVAGMLVSLVP